MNKSELRQLIREAIRESYGSFNDDEHRSKDERSKFLARNSKVNYGFRDYDSDDPRMLGKEEYLSQIQGMSTIEAMIHLIDQGLTEEEAESLVAMLNTDVRDMFNEENDYPTSAPRVYVLMLGNRSRGVMGPYRVYADRASAEAEAARQEDSGRDTKAFVQDLAFIK